MHELSIAKNILDILCARLQKVAEPLPRALDIQVTIGEFRNVDPQSLTFAFDSIKQLYSSCADCSLSLDLPKAVAVCTDSENHSYHPQFDHGFRCTECGGGIARLLSGEELLVTGITLEEEQQQCTK